MMGAPTALEQLAKPIGRLTRFYSVLLITLLIFTSISVFYMPQVRIRQYFHRDGNAEVSVPRFSTTHGLLVDEKVIHSPPPPSDNDEYMAVCMLVKDMPTEVNEFLTHHYYHHGIRRFYIYDDGSSPPLSSQYNATNSYSIPENATTFAYISPDSIDLQARPRLQEETMHRCIRDHGSKHTWLALLDPDEYIEMRSPEFPTLLSWLQHWEQNSTVAGLAISWLPHTSNNKSTLQPAGFRHSFTECLSDHFAHRSDFFTITHSKSFVRPEHVSRLPNIHTVEFQGNVYRVDEHGDEDKGTRISVVPPTYEFWALHHYATGSREYFEKKAERGRSQGQGVWPIDEEYWRRYHNEELSRYRCEEMVQYVP